MTEPKESELFRWIFELIQEPLPSLVSVENPSELQELIQSSNISEHHAVVQKISRSFIDLGLPVQRELRSTFSELEISRQRSVAWEPVMRELEHAVLGSTLRSFGLQSVHALSHPAPSDIAWRSFIRSFGTIIGNRLTEYFDLIDEAPLVSYYTNEAIYMLEWPAYACNERLLLHSADGPAASFKTDSIYAWNGVLVPPRYIERPDTISREEFTREENAERRRALFEIIGPHRYSEMMDLEVVEQSIDGQGNLQSLFRTRGTDRIAKDRLYFAHVTCPSTNRVYHLPVPPHLRTAQEAVAWTFSLDGDDYAPIVET